jgi:hypothetical protein
MSTRDLIRKRKPKVHKVTVDGDDFYVKAFSGATRAEYLTIMKGNEGVPPFAKIVSLGLCESDGTLTYDVESEKDIAELSETDGKTLELIAMELFRVSGLTKEASEEAAKN